MKNYYNLTNIPCKFRQNDKNIPLDDKEFLYGVSWAIFKETA